MIRKLTPLALCMTALMLTAGCSEPTEPKANEQASAPAAAPEPEPEAPAPVADEISLTMAAKYSQWTNSTNAVLMITAETDGVEIKTIRVNGGDCAIVSKEHREVLNTGQQNTYTVSPLCSPERVRRIDVGTSRGTTNFTL